MNGMFLRFVKGTAQWTPCPDHYVNLSHTSVRAGLPIDFSGIEYTEFVTRDEIQQAVDAYNNAPVHKRRIY